MVPFKCQYERQAAIRLAPLSSDNVVLVEIGSVSMNHSTCGDTIV